MAGTEVYARVNKDRRQLLCGRLINGRPTCRGVTAKLHRRSADFGKWLAQEDPDALFIGGVIFSAPLGFSQDKDGIWGLCNYSKQRWNHTRRSLSMAGQGKVRRPQQGLPFPKYRRGLLDEQGWLMQPSCRVRCPECGQEQSITQDMADAAALVEEQRERQVIAPWRAQFVLWQAQLSNTCPRTWGAFQEWLDARAASKQRILKVRIRQCAVRLEALFNAGIYDAEAHARCREQLGNIYFSPYCARPVRAGRVYRFQLPGEGSESLGTSDIVMMSGNGGMLSAIQLKPQPEGDALDDLLNQVDIIRAQLGFIVL